jgi:KDO2-lipid IV(A) lauroyltransferase
MVNLKDIASAPQVIKLGMWLSQHLPQRLGHRLSWWAAGFVCQAKPAVYEIVRANLSQVLGPGTDRATLQQNVRQVFYTTLRSYFDLFRAMQLPNEDVASLVDLTDRVRARIQWLGEQARGSVLVFPHLGGFDVAPQAVASLVPNTQVLTLPNPPAGFRLTNELRRGSGIEITPLSSQALRQAVKRLKAGGFVSVAGDRPVSDLDKPVLFFGRPARVPSGHVRLALKTDALITVGCSFLSPETGKYTIHLEPSLEMVRTGDREEEVGLNMRRVLDLLESLIRRWVGQWQMFVPVWPELLKGEGS